MRCLCIILAALAAAAQTVVYEENFNGFADGDRPSSVYEVRGTPWDRGEVVGRRYAVNAGGNRHQLIMPRVADFELEFTAEPHSRARYAPIMVLDFRRRGAAAYRLFHWFGPGWSRVDLQRLDEAGDSTRLDSTGIPPIDLPQPAPIRWRLTAAGPTFTFYRNDEKLWEFTDDDAPLLAAGTVSLDLSLWTKNATAPLYFDDLRVTSTDPGMADKVRPVWSLAQRVPVDIVAGHVEIVHALRVFELLDTGMDDVRTDVPDGRMYRLVASVNFPDMSTGKGRKMAALTPYVRLETAGGEPVVHQKVFAGILGGTWPGHHSACAQIIRLLTEYPEPPPEGVAIRTAGVADATGPQQAVACFAYLPESFNVTAGWEYWLDNDHIHCAGPVEATWTRAGEPLYAGPPIQPGTLDFGLYSAPSAGILARISPDNQYHANLVRFQQVNHYFLEGEKVAFAVDCRAGIDAPLTGGIHWEVLDCYLRPLDLSGSVPLEAPASRLGDRADRKLAWRTGAFAVPVAAPGVYWLKLGRPGRECYGAFSIVPADGVPGHTAAAASGLPRMDGNFYPMQPWNKDIHHYVSGAGGSRNPDWYEAVHAYNMLAIETGPQPAEVVRQVEGLWRPGLVDAELPDFPPFPDKRLWRRMAANPESVAAFRRSDCYREQPGDDVLAGADADARWQALTARHLKEWCDYWSDVWADYEVAMREQLDAVKPGLVTSSYGPRLISSYYYGNLYCGKYYGWDWRRRLDRPHLVNCWQVETYAREFGRASMSYTPSLALTKMSLPGVDCKWENYGTLGGVEDSRLVFGRPPHGMSVPNRAAVANHCTELSLAPWYFKDGRFVAASGTHLAPWVGHYTQDQLFGIVDALRIFHEAEAVRPVRTTAFVRSYAAAELDPSWQEQSVNNAAAEAPAYAYVQARLAGLPGGCFLDIADVAALDPATVDVLVIPSMRGATPDQVQAIRAKYAAGVALCGFDDCTGLEDIFGVRRRDQPAAIRAVAVTDPAGVLADIPADARAERVTHTDLLPYDLAGATEILAGVDGAGERLGPLLTINRPAGKPGAVFQALGSTRVGRRRKSLDDTNHEGEVASALMRHAVRAALRAVARPVLTVTAPASVLAFRRADGAIYAVVLESSFPNPDPAARPVEILLTVHAADPAAVRFAAAVPLLEMPAAPGRRTVKLVLAPDQVVPLTVSGVPTP